MKRSIKKTVWSFLVILILLFESVPLYADTAPEIIRVGYYETKNFQEYDEETGEYSGYSYEFLMALAQYANWTYEFVPCTFNDGLTMLENGEIDILNNVSKTKEREEVLDFTTLNSGENIAFLAMRPGDTRVAFGDYEAIETIKIGLDENSIYSNLLLELFEKNEISPEISWYDSHDAVKDAFWQEEVDACIITSSILASEHIILSFAPNSYFIAATKGSEDVIQTLDAAILELRLNNPYFEPNLKEKYYRQPAENYMVLTHDEQDYIDHNPLVTVTYQPDWYPLTYTDDNGEFAGAIRSYFDLLEERTGLQFEYIPAEETSGENGIADNIQVMAELPSDFGYADQFQMKLTQAFVSPSLMEVANHLLAPGDTIVLVEGDYLTQLCKRIYGEKFQYIFCDSIEQCMEMVKNENADGTVLISYESEYYRQQRTYNSLTYKIIDEASYSLAIGVSNNEDPRLYQIMQKGVTSISTSEVSTIFNDALVSVRNEDLLTFMYQNPILTILILIVVIALLLGSILAQYYNRKLKRKNELISSKNDALYRANQSTADFYARMSHDMRTPLNGILGSVELAIDAEEHSPQMSEYLHDIQFSGAFLLNLINDVLDMSKIESGAMELVPEVYTYFEFIDNMIKMIEPLCRKKNITLNMNPLKDDCAIRVDILRFQQIFFNIFSNAVKYTPEGGTIDHYTEIVPIDANHIDCKCHIIDNGIGMSEEYQKHLFEPYSQEKQKNSNEQGTGLGLSIANQLTHMMGGELTVKSELGKGTEVIIHTVLEVVELSEKNDKQRKNNFQTDKDTIKGCRILLCEDHPLNAKIAIQMLMKWGAIVDHAENGELGVKMFTDSKAGDYDLILMDIRMPIMDGLQAARNIRALERPDAKTIPIIAMTANAYETDMKKSLEAGMNAHLAKPIEPPKLYEEIRKFLLAEETE